MPSGIAPGSGVDPPLCYRQRQRLFTCSGTQLPARILYMQADDFRSKKSICKSGSPKYDKDACDSKINAMREEAKALAKQSEKLAEQSYQLDDAAKSLLALDMSLGHKCRGYYKSAF